MCKIDDIFAGVFKILFRQRGLALRLSLIGPHISWPFLSSPSESDALLHRHVIVLKVPYRTLCRKSRFKYLSLVNLSRSLWGFKQCIIQRCKITLHPTRMSPEKDQKWRISYIRLNIHIDRVILFLFKGATNTRHICMHCYHRIGPPTLGPIPCCKGFEVSIEAKTGSTREL